LHTKQQHPFTIRPIRQTYLTRRKVNIKKDTKTKDFSILFKKNYKNWFKRTKVKIKEKRAYYLIESNRTEYAWIHKEKKTADISKKEKPNIEKTTITTNTTDNSKINNFTNKFE